MTLVFHSPAVTLIFGLMLALPVTGLANDAEKERDTWPATAIRTQERLSLQQASKGLHELRAGSYGDASRYFNTALKYEPENAHLHFLNGFSYHLLYTQGHHANRDLAETAYNLALRLEPNHALSAYYLGLLHLDARQYAKAQAAFAHALLLERDDPSLLQALAVASYYAYDLGMAQWAVERLEESQDTSADNLRTAALVYAAAGRIEDALKRTDKLQAMAGPDAGNHVRKRVKHWRAYHESNSARLIHTANQTTPVAPEAPSDAKPTQATSPSSPTPAAAEPETTPSVVDENAVRNWSDCPQNAAALLNNSSYSWTLPYSSSSNDIQDETSSLPALPAPCDRRFLPRMALLDTAIVSTFDNITTKKGINLLDGLRLLLSASLEISKGTGAPRTRTYNRKASLINSLDQDGILAYSLNIANAGNEWNQVLARPTLVSLDRQPSTFFSGTSLVTTIQGTASNTGSLVEQPAGISLSVTPTFIDDETILLSVKVARSFFAGGTDLKDTVTQSRNAVSANVLIKMGETLILSGLTERQLFESKDGVPLMKDIPLLQYIFSTESKSEFTQSVLVMITPRPPATGVNASLTLRDKAIDPRQQSSLDELREQIPQALRPAPNLDTVFLDMDDNRLFREFRAGDLRPQDWRRPSFVERTLRQIGDFLYY